jgi:chemotaxis protein histidine kinase CheA
LDQVEVNAKVKELEDEVKILKAEIRNVLLDIREAILENTNPLSEQEPAYLRMDLNTTARAMAAEEATRAAREAIDQAKGKLEELQAEEPKAEEPKAEEPKAEEPKAEEPEPDLPPEEEEAAEQAEGQEPTEDEPEEPEAGGNGSPSAKGKASPKARFGRTLPPMQLAYMLPTGAVGGLAAWVTEAMATIGPQDLERVITIHRLWGSLPPNISYALAHLQRLIRSSQQADPAWLKVMQDMEKLASS